MRHFVAKAGKNSVNFVYQAKVESITKVDENRYKVHVVYPDGARFSYHTRYVINCAGLEADTIAETMGIDVGASGYRQLFAVI
jgi:L-2-hydroxyglutarate oxidase LhgO